MYCYVLIGWNGMEWLMLSIKNIIMWNFAIYNENKCLNVIQ